MPAGNRHFTIYNKSEDTCDICLKTIGKCKNHLHFSAHKRLVDCISTLPDDGQIPCFLCADRHTITGGNRTAFVLLDKARDRGHRSGRKPLSYGTRGY